MEETGKPITKESKEDDVWLWRKCRKHPSCIFKVNSFFSTVSMFKKRQATKKGGEIVPLDTIPEPQQELLIVLFCNFYQPLH